MSEQLNLLLADDDVDDRFFFDKALKVLPISSALITVEDGAELMKYLSKNTKQLPDVLFLDLNMPRKNGLECLEEIKSNNLLKHLPVIIYSTSLHEDVADVLYKTGAHFYIRKGGLAELETTLLNVLTMLKEKQFVRPLRNKFILSLLAF
ncbi:MAG: response regulator [Bacteroidetes bacterium]|nr:response regulator [Bacteroidota bacterium]